MILAKNEILSEIRKGNIRITPFKKNAVGACSVDLSLGDVFRRFEKSERTISVSEAPDYAREYSSLLVSKEGITIAPGELILGVTKERLRLSNKLCGWIQGRSRFARVGLMVHLSASLIQPDVDNMQVLEIVNLSPVPLRIKPGLRVCQVVFERLTSSASYEGPFKHQTTP